MIFIFYSLSDDFSVFLSFFVLKTLMSNQRCFMQYKTWCHNPFFFYTENQSDFYLTLLHFIRLCNIIRWHQHLMLREVLNGFQHLPLGLKSIFDRCYFKFLNERNKHGWGNKSSKNIIEKIMFKYTFLPSLISNMHFVKPFFLIAMFLNRALKVKITICWLKLHFSKHASRFP